ncbi:MAG: rod shape-determining protein MreC [Simkaniaceae bacterium]
MRSKKFWPKGLPLILFIFCLSFALPQKTTQNLRLFSHNLFHFAQNPLGKSTYIAALDQLETENEELKRQLNLALEWLKKEGEKPHFAQNLVPARVLFREPNSWQTTLWLNIGSDDRQGLKNAPVIIGRSLIGLIESVEAKRSKVRLILDPSLSVAVRTLRGGEANRELKHHLTALFEILTRRDDLFTSFKKKDKLLNQLAHLDVQLNEKETLHLAKGETKGASSLFWRSFTSTIKGIGFHYDETDKYGPARELRTGKPYGELHALKVALIEEGDLLVTSGLDGIFPENLHVGRVLSVSPLEEGAISYEIEASLTAGSLEDLKHCYILLPHELN